MSVANSSPGDFIVDWTSQDACRNSVHQSEESLSDYKSVDSGRNSWYTSTRSVISLKEEFYDCTSSGANSCRNSVSIQLSDLEFCEEGQQKTENLDNADSDCESDNIFNDSNHRNSVLDNEDELQTGSSHGRGSFEESNVNPTEEKHSEINIFGKMQGNSFFKLEFSWLTKLKVVVSIVFYFLDVYFDISLAIDFSSKGLMLYFWLTAGVVIIQLLISAIYDISQFRTIDRKATQFSIVEKVPVWLWILRIFGLLLGIVPVYRTILFAIYAYKANSTKDKHERTRFSLLLFAEKMSTFSLFIKESYFESAPQLILQLCIMFKYQQRHEEISLSQLRSVTTSLLSFAWSLKEYDSNCAALFFNIDFTFFSSLFIFLWRLLTTFSQAALTSLCFSSFPVPFIFICLTDYVILTMYSCIMADTAKSMKNLSMNKRWTSCYIRIQQCRYVFFVNIFSALPLLISFVFYSEIGREIQIVCYYTATGWSTPAS